MPETGKENKNGRFLRKVPNTPSNKNSDTIMLTSETAVDRQNMVQKM